MDPATSISTNFGIVADIGGTYTRIATLTGEFSPLSCIEVLHCADFVHLEDAITHYLERNVATKNPNAGALCLAVPGSVHDDHIFLANSSWDVSRQHLGDKFHCPIFLINDFAAQALSIPKLTDKDIEWLRPGIKPPANKLRSKLIIGPGTGLGVATLLPNGEVLDSEAGHVSFAPNSELQMEILQFMETLFPRVSVERLVSGPGLANIYRAITAIAGFEEKLSPEEITRNAFAGDAHCLAAIDELSSMFGSVCGDIALTAGALGGVYLSGGVLDNLGKLFSKELFLQAFNAKGRFTDYCKSIPIAKIISPYPGLCGAAEFLSVNNRLKDRAC